MGSVLIANIAYFDPLDWISQQPAEWRSDWDIVEVSKFQAP